MNLTTNRTGKHPSFPLAAALATAASIFASGLMSAATVVWDGDTNMAFSDGVNWVGGSAPANNITSDIAAFGNTLTPNLPTLFGPRSVNGITFGTADWTLGGGANALTIGSGGIVAANSSTNVRTVNANVLLAADQTWTYNNSVSIGLFTVGVFNNPIGTTGGPFNLTVAGGGRVDLKTNATLNLGTGATLTVRDGSYLNFSDVTTPDVSNVGRVDLQNGLLAVAGPLVGGVALNAFGSASVAATVNIGAGGQLTLGFGSAPQANRLRDTTSIALAGGILTANRGGNGSTNTETIGAVSFAGGQSVYKVDASNASASTVSSASSITRSSGNGSLFFSGDNLQIGAAAGGRAQMIFSTAPTGLIGGGGSTASTTAKNISIIPWAFGDNSTSTTKASASQGNPDGFGKGFVTYDATAGVRLLTNTNYDNAFGTATSNIRLIANNATSGAQIGNALLIDSNGTAGANLAIAGDNTLAITSGALMLAGDTSSTTNAQQTLATISGYTGIVFGSTGTPVEGFITVSAIYKDTDTSNIFGTPYLTPGKLTIASPITHANGISMSGPGTLVLSGANSYSGGTVINAGTLQLGSGGTLPSGTTLAINGSSRGIVSGGPTEPASPLRTSQSAIFDLNGQNQTVAGLTGFAGTGGGATGIVTNTAGSTTSTLTHTGTSTFDGIIQNGASGTGVVAITKTTGGTLTLTNANTYTGATTVSAGTLLIAGGNINATSGVSVSAGATFTNNSATSFTKNLTLVEGAGAAGSVINGSGTFAAANMAIGSTLSDGFTTFALGSATFTKGGTLALTLSGITNGDYTLFSGGTIGGAFTGLTINGFGLTHGGGGNFSGTTGGYDYTFTNSSNLLTVVPEPSTWALLAFSLTTVMVLRRRRNS